jgi:Family of unknown function (DUF6084)
MPDLDFAVDDVEVVPYAASPLLHFRLTVRNANPEETIHTVALRCQVHIEATRRRYAPGEERRLRDLFGEPSRWSQTLRTMLWTHASTVISAFTGCTEATLPVTCTYDFNIAATKFFHGVDDGEIPLSFLFSGTVFFAGENGSLLAAPISWDKEARFRLPVATWKEMMDLYYPNVAWLTLRRDVFDRLNDYKTSRGMLTWEQALEQILPPAGEVEP